MPSYVASICTRSFAGFPNPTLQNCKYCVYWKMTDTVRRLVEPVEQEAFDVYTKAAKLDLKLRGRAVPESEKRCLA